MELIYILDGSTPTGDWLSTFGLRERSICSRDRRASRPEFPSIPRIRFLSAYGPDSLGVWERDPVHFRGSLLPSFLSHARRQALAMNEFNGAGLYKSFLILVGVSINGL